MLISINYQEVELSGIKGMKWGVRKEYIHKKLQPRGPTIIQRLDEMGADRRLYSIWNAMHARCYNPKNTSYLDYGGRGDRKSVV